jgi:hypothetical protein
LTRSIPRTHYGIIPSVSQKPRLYSYADAGEAVLARYLIEQGRKPKEIREPAVLVTFDNRLPVQHATLIARYGTTLAIIDKDAQPPDLTREEYWREVIHRHAHRMAHQDAGSRFKYTRRQRRPLPYRRGKPSGKAR